MSNTDLKAATLDCKGFRIKGNRVLIECEGDTDTFGKTSIIKPESFKKYSRCGYIRQAGTLEDVKASDPVSIGDKVYYDAYSGQDLELSGVDYKAMPPSGLLCKLKDNDLKAIGSRTIIIPIENIDEETVGGIILSSAVKEKYSDSAMVVDSDVFNPGDKVIFTPYGYSQILLNDKTYFVVNTEDIIGQTIGE